MVLELISAIVYSTVRNIGQYLLTDYKVYRSEINSFGLHQLIEDALVGKKPGFVILRLRKNPNGSCEAEFVYNGKRTKRTYGDGEITMESLRKAEKFLRKNGIPSGIM